MSISDHNGETIVKLSVLWEWAFKLWLVVTPICFTGFFGWGLWVTTSIYSHDRQIAVLQAHGGKGGVSQSVNVGAASSVAKEDDGKHYLSVKDVASRQNPPVSERTVLNWIEQGRLHPMPTKEGKEWVISESFRILPHFAENVEKP